MYFTFKTLNDFAGVKARDICGHGNGSSGTHHVIHITTVFVIRIVLRHTNNTDIRNIRVQHGNGIRAITAISRGVTAIRWR